MSCWLITGGTGSLGQALVRRLLADGGVERIVVYSRDELKQARMAAALGSDAALDGGRVRFFLGDVRDLERLELALRGVDVVVHAAALKRVDAVAYNPSEVMKTNIEGTWRVCLAAMRARVHRVVFTSSDKAVQPTNLYGASKFLAERLVIGANVYGVPQGTSFVAVRYGNVAGSRGSVIHLWRAAVAAGHPVSLTDERMTRFWLTLEEACSLVRTAATEELEPGDVLVPALPGFRVRDLLSAIAGATYAFTVTGRRSGGEKLDEVLLAEPELPLTEPRAASYVVHPDPRPWGARMPRLKVVGLPDGFTYSSASAPRLSVDDLRARLVGVPGEAP